MHFLTFSIFFMSLLAPSPSATLLLLFIYASSVSLVLLHSELTVPFLTFSPVTSFLNLHLLIQLPTLLRLLSQFPLELGCLAASAAAAAGKGSVFHHHCSWWGDEGQSLSRVSSANVKTAALKETLIFKQTWCIKVFVHQKLLRGNLPACNTHVCKTVLLCKTSAWMNSCGQRFCGLISAGYSEGGAPMLKVFGLYVSVCTLFPSSFSFLVAVAMYDLHFWYFLVLSHILPPKNLHSIRFSLQYCYHQPNTMDVYTCHIFGIQSIVLEAVCITAGLSIGFGLESSLALAA